MVQEGQKNSGDSYPPALLLPAPMPFATHEHAILYKVWQAKKLKKKK